MLYQHTSQFYHTKHSPTERMDRYYEGGLQGEICPFCQREVFSFEDIEAVEEWRMCLRCDHLLTDE